MSGESMDTTETLRAALARSVGDAAADALFDRLGRYSNTPNLIAGVGKLPGDERLEAAALDVVRDPALVDALGIEPGSVNPDRPQLDAEVWALLTVAARADPDVLDGLPDDVAAENAPKVRSIQRAARTHAAARAAEQAAPPAEVDDTAPGLPTKVSEVKAWIAADPDVDPAVLAPRPGQRAGERRAALRALATLGGDAAFGVLARYARERYPDTDLAELHRMWGTFDRRVFAATMFGPGAQALDLGASGSLEGIGAVEGLASLDLVFLGEADLGPLGECASLRRLHIISNLAPSITSFEPLVGLEALRVLDVSGVTRNADVSVIARLPLTHLRFGLDGADGAFLLDMPSLRSLELSGGSTPDDHRGVGNAGFPDDLPAHPDLPNTVIELARRGVDVVVHRHERSWVDGLLELAADTDGVDIDEVSGRVALTTGESSRDDLRRRMRSNTITP